VVARILSARKANRVKLAAKIRSKTLYPFLSEKPAVHTALADGLYLASLMAFNEGIQMLFVASREKLNLPWLILPEFERMVAFFEHDF
jgi:6-phosphogluconate dehydrogenase